MGTKYWPPVLGISGYSSSGKTTLIEQVLPHLIQENIHILVIKKHGHEESWEAEGKDTRRFYTQGADSLLEDSRQSLYHFHVSQDLEDILRMIPSYYDLVLVEGHRHAAIPKIWLGDGEETHDIIKILRDKNASRCQNALDSIRTWLFTQWQDLPIAVAVITNWEHKNSIELHKTQQTCELAKTISQHVYLLGPWSCKETVYVPSCEVPYLPSEFSNVWNTAFRWLPDHRWLFLPHDFTTIYKDISLHLKQIRYGIWYMALHEKSVPFGIVYPNIFFAQKMRPREAAGWLQQKTTYLLEKRHALTLEAFM